MTEDDSPLRIWRKGKGVTLSDLAAKLRTTGSNLSRVETGFHRAGLRLQDRIVDTTGLTRDQIAEPWLRRQPREPQDKERTPALEVVQ